MTLKEKTTTAKNTESIEERKSRLIEGIRQSVFQRIRKEHAERFEGAMDTGDLSTASLLDSLEFRLAVMQEEELEKIVAAEGKLNNGTYGVCENCGRKIARKRLAAIPFALHCLECERNLESKKFRVD